MKKGLIIAEVGQAHDGSLGMAHAFIDALADTGVDIVKFQMHIAEAESSEYERFRIPFSYEDDTRFEYWHRTSFSLDQWRTIRDHCDQVGLEFMASPFSNQAVDWLESLATRRYKVGSGESTNYLLLEKIRRTGKPVIISSGMSDYRELDEAVHFFEQADVDCSIVQCTTAYPTPFEQLGLNVISEMKLRYPNKKVGLSEHTGDVAACLAAAALGADIFEFHITFDQRMFGPDSSSSLSIDEVTALVRGIRAIEASLNHPVNKNDIQTYGQLRTMFGKSLAINKDLAQGHEIQFDDLEGKKPGDRGIPAASYASVIGRTLTRDMRKWEFLTLSDFE